MRHALLLPLLLAAGCETNRTPYSPVENVRYSAIGQEPFWMVTIGDDSIVLAFGPRSGRTCGEARRPPIPAHPAPPCRRRHHWTSLDGPGRIGTTRARVLARARAAFAIATGARPPQRREMHGCGGPGSTPDEHLSDRWIGACARGRFDRPFVEAQRREGSISYGLSSYGYTPASPRTSRSSPMSTTPSSIPRISPRTASSTASWTSASSRPTARARPYRRIFPHPAT